MGEVFLFRIKYFSSFTYLCVYLSMFSCFFFQSIYSRHTHYHIRRVKIQILFSNRRYAYKTSTSQSVLTFSLKFFNTLQTHKSAAQRFYDSQQPIPTGQVEKKHLFLIFSQIHCSRSIPEWENIVRSQRTFINVISRMFKKNKYIFSISRSSIKKYVYISQSKCTQDSLLLNKPRFNLSLSIGHNSKKLNISYFTHFIKKHVFQVLLLAV